MQTVQVSHPLYIHPEVNEIWTVNGNDEWQKIGDAPVYNFALYAESLLKWKRLGKHFLYYPGESTKFDPILGCGPGGKQRDLSSGVVVRPGGTQTILLETFAVKRDKKKRDTVTAETFPDILKRVQDKAPKQAPKEEPKEEEAKEEPEEKEEEEAAAVESSGSNWEEEEGEKDQEKDSADSSSSSPSSVEEEYKPAQRKKKKALPVKGTKAKKTKKAKKAHP